MRITVFTPTYNRGYIIKKLYDSLCRQTFHDFEWIVVDDGSSDNTEELFKSFSDDSFPITYVKVKNGGKHRAINKGVGLAQGELFFIVDSDDYLTDTALEQIDKVARSIPLSEKNEFAGVCGEKGHTEVSAVGTSFDGKYLDITMLERKKYGISGDKAEVFYTEVLKKYPFPEYEGEKFVTECVVWDRIAHDGLKLRFFNEIVYICDYLPDGLTAKYEQLLWENPRGYGTYLYQSGEWGRYFGVQKWNQYLRYYYHYRKELPFPEIARNLYQNPWNFWWRLLGLRLFYKLYDR